MLQNNAYRPHTRFATRHPGPNRPILLRHSPNRRRHRHPTEMRAIAMKIFTSSQNI